MNPRIKVRMACAQDAPALAAIYRPYVEGTAISFEYEAPSADEFASRMARIMARYPYVVAEDESGVVVGDTLCTTECANGTRAWRCLHLDGTVSLVLNKPERGVRPEVVFSNNPKVRSFEERIVPDLAPRNAKR